MRLSRDLHDLLGHNLSVIALKSQLARRLLGRDVHAAEKVIVEIEAVARDSLQEARAAVRGLRGASLAAEVDHAREALEAAGIEVAVRLEGQLPAEVEAPLAFAVREAATNAIRHSRARRCEISVRQGGKQVELEVRDDGVGAGGSSGAGSGLRGIRERLGAAGGALDAAPEPCGGFKLTLACPSRRQGAGRRRGG